jgi:hypothetical protein
MATLGGKREGAGRKPNIANRINRELKKEAADKYPNFNPLIELIDFYHTTEDQKLRLEAIKEILKKYVPDLKAIDHSSSDGTAILAPLILRPSDITTQP